MNGAQQFVKILEIARRSNPDAIRHVYVSRNGKSYEFTDDYVLVGEYIGEVKCQCRMPGKLEEQVSAAENK